MTQNLQNNDSTQPRENGNTPPALHYKLSIFLGVLLLLLTIAVIAKGHLLWSLLTGFLGLLNIIPGIIIARSAGKLRRKRDRTE